MTTRTPGVSSTRTDTYPLLLIDAGNSRVKWALLESNGRRQAGGFFDRQWSPEAEAPLLADWHPLPTPVGIWMSNVAGDAVAARIKALLARQWPTSVVHQIRSCATQCGIVNHYLTPSQLGSDRWAGMIGARADYPGEALLIATLGTATTLDAVDADGHFVGGLIAPGWTLMMRSLGEHTAQLPTLTRADAGRLLDGAQPPAAHSALSSLSPVPQRSADISRAVDAHMPTGSVAREGAHAGAPTYPLPPTYSAHPTHKLDLFAQDTATALAEGCRLAQVGLIESAWRTLSAQHSASLDTQDRTKTSPVRIIVGGGAAPEVVRSLRLPYTRHDDLVLEGLALIAQTDMAASLNC